MDLQRWKMLMAVVLVAGGAVFGLARANMSLSAQIHLPPSSQLVSKYTGVQYLGFQIFTTPGTTADGCFSNDQSAESSLDECYLGSPKVMADLETRLDIMTTALENAHASPHWDRSSSVLKVFMAPEFYWRGARGAYRLGIAGSALEDITRRFSRFVENAKWKDWLIIPGTKILAEEADKGFTKLMEKPSQNISYYNVAPILVGGTKRRLLEFKHYISGIDFIQATPKTIRTKPIEAAPGSGTEYCKLHPDSNGCVYSTLPSRVLRHFGYEEVEVVSGNVFHLEGLKVGIEVCLDHLMSQLGTNLAPRNTVDLHLITSAGMNIGFGAVGTRAGGPTFLSDGYAETSVSLNEFGGGRTWATSPSGQRVYNVGEVYEADSLIGLQQWLGDSFYAITGTGFGTNAAGRHSLPSGSKETGLTGIPFHAVSALGSSWREKLLGFYDTSDYDLTNKMYARFDKTVEGLEKEVDKFHQPWDTIGTTFAYPTVDFYGPFQLDQ